MFGALHSPWAVLLPLAGVLTGLAYAAPIAAYTATQENANSFPVFYRFAIIPMFLFSGGFYPISQLPGWLQAVVQFVPLYHGVALCRTLALGQGSLAATLYHVAVLAALAVVGTSLCMRSFRRRLEVVMAAALDAAHHARRARSARGAPSTCSSATRMIYRKGWYFLVSGFFEPFFYLLSLGIGLNHLIGTVHGRVHRRSPTPRSSRRACSRCRR